MTDQSFYQPLVSGSDIQMSPQSNNKVFLAYASDYDQMDPETSFLKPQLLGGSVEYDIDMTKANCGCDADIYLVALPAISGDG